MRVLWSVVLGGGSRQQVKEWLRWWREECQPDWNSPQQPPGITVDSHPRTDFFGSLNGLVSGLVAVTGFCNVAHRREVAAQMHFKLTLVSRRIRSLCSKSRTLQFSAS
eukprot:5172877-Amphidinium_carterae.2